MNKMLTSENDTPMTVQDALYYLTESDLWQGCPASEIEVIAKLAELIQKQHDENEQLKKQLERAIVPKFKIGQECLLVVTNILNGAFVKLSDVSIWAIVQDIRGKFSYEVVEISISRHLHVNEFELFATREEAEAALRGGE